MSYAIPILSLLGVVDGEPVFVVLVVGVVVEPGVDGLSEPQAASRSAEAAMPATAAAREVRSIRKGISFDLEIRERAAPDPDTVSPQTFQVREWHLVVTNLLPVLFSAAARASRPVR